MIDFVKKLKHKIINILNYYFLQPISNILYKLTLHLMKTMPPRYRALLTQDLEFQLKSRFHPEVICHIASALEYKRSQQVLPEQITAWLDSFELGEVFYDVGANIGMFGLYVSKHHKKAVQVLAFEPSFSTFDVLMRNVALNGVSDSMWCFQIALSEQSGLRVFNYSDLRAGSSHHGLDVSINESGTNFTPLVQQTLISYTLDDFVKGFKIPAPNHIKIDVDGGEFKVLQGADTLLRGISVKTLLVEIVDAHPDDEHASRIIQFMGVRGFEVVDSVVHNKTPGYPRVSDYLFKRKADS